MLLQVLQLDTNLSLQCLIESEIGLDDGVLTKSTLSMNICIAEVGLTNRHLQMLVSMPYHLTPVLTTSVERSAVIKNVTLEHFKM